MESYLFQRGERYAKERNAGMSFIGMLVNLLPTICGKNDLVYAGGWFNNIEVVQ